MSVTTVKTLGTTLEIRECPECGVTYGAPERFFESRRSDGKTFYCPNGHSLSWHETDADRLRKQLKAAQDNARYYQDRMSEARQERDAEKRSKAAIKGQLTKTKKRVSNGVCPCCNRHFVNLERHMHGQHPDYGTADE